MGFARSAGWVQAYVFLLMGSLVGASQEAMAQVLPDDTLGSESSVVLSGVEVRGLPAELVEGGAQRDSNLFHSFFEFNVDAGQRVYFANPADTERIFSRVTGANPSAIDGLLGVDGPASLYFLNPNGVIFGPEASLDVLGSFVVSTAAAFGFEDGGEFSAVDLGDSSLLTVSVPLGLQVGPAPRDESVISSEGSLVAGQDLTLFANEVDLQGQVAAGNNLTLFGSDTVKARDSTSNPFIGFSGEDLLVQGNEQVDIVVLSHPDSGLFSLSNMVLRSANQVNGDAHYWSGGNFRIEDLNEDLGDLFSPIDPIIRSFGNVSFGSYEGTSLHILAGGSVDVSSIEITGPAPGTLGVDFLEDNILLSDGKILVKVNGAARPTLDIRAGVNPGIIGFESLFPTGFNFLQDRFPDGIPLSLGSPLRADITITDSATIPPNGQILLTNQYQPRLQQDGDISISGGIGNIINFVVSAEGDSGPEAGIYTDSRNNTVVGTREFSTAINTSATNGEIGNIVILSNDDVTIFDTDIFASLVDTGTAGDIYIKGNNIDTTFSNIRTQGGQLGDSGRITLTASNVFTFKAGTILTSIGFFSDGNGGNISILGKEVYIGGTDSGITQPVTISSGFFGEAEGIAGNIIIGNEETTTTSIYATGISAGFEPSGGERSSQSSGIGGNIAVGADEIIVRLSNINTDTEGAEGQSGIAGGITFQGSESIKLENNGGFGVISGTFFDISASTTGTSDAGTITLDAPLVIIDDTSVGTLSDPFLFDDLNQPGDGGFVRVIADELQVLSQSELSAKTRGEGDAGGIIIEEASIVRFDDSSASVSVEQRSTESTITGDGGGIAISSRFVELVNGSAINAATSGSGTAGNISLETNQLNVMGDSQITVSTEESGEAGNISIESFSNGPKLMIDFEDGSEISGITRSDQPGGNILISAPDSVTVNGGGSITVETSGQGRAGRIDFRTNALNLQNGLTVSAASSGGPGGNITIQDTDTVLIDNSTLTSELLEGIVPSIQGGDVRISATDIRITNDSELRASTNGAGNAGNVIIENADNVLFDNSIASSESGSGDTTENNVTGDGQNVQVQARNLQLINGSELRSISTSQGDAGNVILNIDENFQSIDSNVRTNSENTSGGVIEIAADVIRLRGDSDITTFVNDGEGGGGNIDITSDSVIAFDDSDILAFSIDGRGGNVTIDAPYFFGDSFEPAPANTDPRTLDNNDRVDVNASGAVDGVISIPDVSFVQNSLTELPDALVDPNVLTAGSCIARTEESTGSFTTTGTDGLPQRPSDTAGSQFPAVEVEPLTNEETPVIWHPDEPIVEPNAVYQFADGRFLMGRECL